MIKLLFENNKNIPLKFYAKTNFNIQYFSQLLYKKQFEFIFDHLVMSEVIWLSFYLCDYISEEEQHNMLLKLILYSKENFYCVCIFEVKGLTKLYNLIIKNIT
ncbi:hypothetical protein Mgra_00001049 [Meloidogyne graminicola]|uniref:Uncharacterized protein n=1 Tax=Meloidogyne graminicola TaxID=189291 RepID=A0A8T0A1D5_9BILA|nr:hypothetical protein Mgra_00001049 [Meloidogyne graminicola]